MVGRHRVVLFLLPLSLLPAACWVPVDQTSSDAGPDAGGSGGGGAAGTNGWGAPKGQGGYPTLCTLGEPAPVVRTRAPEATGGCVETPSAMPGIRDGLGAATAPGGRIYLVGGWGDYNGGCETSALTVYDPGRDHYQVLTSVPTLLRGEATVAFAGGKLLAFEADTWIYDPGSGSWAKGARAPEGGAFSRAAVTGPDDRVYVFGGLTNGNRATLVYDPATDAWTRLPSLPFELDVATAAFAGGRFYVIDFYLGGAAVFDPATAAWARIAAPTWRGGARAFGDGAGGVLVVGGSRVAGQSSDLVERYDPTTDTWTSRAPLPVATMLAAIAPGCGGKLYVFGGQTNDHARYPVNGITDVVQAYDPVANAWTRSP